MRNGEYSYTCLFKVAQADGSDLANAALGRAPVSRLGCFFIFPYKQIAKWLKTYVTLLNLHFKHTAHTHRYFNSLEQNISFQFSAVYKNWSHSLFTSPRLPCLFVSALRMCVTQQFFPFPLRNKHQQNPRDYISQLNDDNMEFQEALAAVVRELQICYTLKEEQL